MTIAPPRRTGVPFQPAPRHPIWLVRHAATSWTGRRWCGRADPGLTAAGQSAAGRLATELVGAVGPDSVLLASPALRAQQTADAIADAIGLVVRLDADLLEADVGACEGLTWKELSARHPVVAADLAAGRRPDWPGGESGAAVERRAAAAAARIRSEASVQPVVVVSHSGLLHALAATLRAGMEAAATDDRLVLGPAEFVRLDLVGGG